MKDGTTDSEPIINYPKKEDGSLVSRGERLPPFPSRSIPSTQPGSLHHLATLAYGSSEQFVQLIESIVAGQGQIPDPEWQRFCVLYREWQRQRSAGQIKRDPNLNDVQIALKIETESFFGRLANAIGGLFRKLAMLKAVQKLPDLVDAMSRAIEDTEHGFNDRKLMAEIGGLYTSKSGVQVNVNQQVGMRVGINNNLPALSQFSSTVEAVDDVVRDAAKERAALPPADLSNVIEGEIIKDEKDGIFVGSPTNQKIEKVAEEK